MATEPDSVLALLAGDSIFTAWVTVNIARARPAACGSNRQIDTGLTALSVSATAD